MVKAFYEVIKMDYSGFQNFPFPEELTKREEKLKEYFFSLPDHRQLDLLKGCPSYEAFCGRMEKECL